MQVMKESIREIKRKPITNIRTYYQGLSNLFYILTFTTMKDSTIIKLITIKLDLKRSGATTNNPLFKMNSQRRKSIVRLSDLHKITNTLNTLFL